MTDRETIQMAQSQRGLLDNLEVVSLNLEDLDVEELERRLEMATGNSEPWVCGVNSDCIGDCPNLQCGSNER